MTSLNIPHLSELELNDLLLKANKSPRARFPRLMHKEGDELNRVFNVMLADSYMQPHCHPGDEKIEKIYLVYGEVVIIFFDENGIFRDPVYLNEPKKSFIEIPAFAWHTYVILTEYAVTYETMMGIYNPETWKRMAKWAPKEGSNESKYYLQNLKSLLG